MPYGGLAALAELLGVTTSHLSHYLSGRRSSMRLDRALQAIGLTREQIVPSHAIGEATSGLHPTLNVWTLVKSQANRDAVESVAPRRIRQQSKGRQGRPRGRTRRSTP
jgi:transcriptional regulator with XRE-family HTH domain